MAVGALQIDGIRARLRTKRIGKCIRYLTTTTSTNDEVWRHLRADHVDGLVVFAEHQSAGRGRFGRKWHSPRGASLLCSVALVNEHAQTCDKGRERQACAQTAGDAAQREPTGGDLGLLAGVAVGDAVEVNTGLRPSLRWPNDLILSNRKLGGILIESRRQCNGRAAHVIGIGINCYQQRGHFEAVWGESATSLDLESARPVDRTALAVALLTELDRWLAEPQTWNAAELRTRWLARAEPMGRPVCLRHAGRMISGTILDVDPSAALVVRLDDGGIRAFDAATTTVAHRHSSVNAR